MRMSEEERVTKRLSDSCGWEREMTSEKGERKVKIKNY